MVVHVCVCLYVWYDEFHNGFDVCLFFVDKSLQ